MTDYESVYNDALNDEEVPIGALIDDIHQITHAAGLAAVVAAAKAEGWDEGLGSGRDRWLDSREFGSVPVNPYRTKNN